MAVAPALAAAVPWQATLPDAELSLREWSDSGASAAGSAPSGRSPGVAALHRRTMMQPHFHSSTGMGAEGPEQAEPFRQDSSSSVGRVACAGRACA